MEHNEQHAEIPLLQQDDSAHRLTRHREQERSFGGLRIAHYGYDRQSSPDSYFIEKRIVYGVILGLCQIRHTPLTKPCNLIPCGHMFDMWCILG